MNKTFTLGEAQMLLPVVEALLKRVQGTALRAGEYDREMQQLNHRIFLTGGLHVNVAMAARRRAEREKALQEGKDTLEEMEAIGVHVHDLAQGLVDFPCTMDGRTVLLCWRLGETAVGHWHEEEGERVEDRRAVEDLFGKSERERLN